MAQYERPWKEAMKDDTVVRKNFRVFYQSATPMEDHLDYCLIDHQICKDSGVADLPGYRFIVHPQNTCKWSSWRMGIRDFVKLLFREEEVYQDKEKLREFD